MVGKRVIGWAARDPSGHLSPFAFALRKAEPEDVLFKVLFCGMDHTELHQMRSEGLSTNMPFGPGALSCWRSDGIGFRSEEIQGRRHCGRREIIRILWGMLVLQLQRGKLLQ